VIFYGCVGKDNSEKVLNDLKSYGFETNLVKISEKNNTGNVIVVTNKNGENAIYLYMGANQELNIKDIPNDIFSEVDAIYTDTGNDLDFDYALIKKANLHNLPIFFDVPNKHKDFDKTKKHKIDFFMPNRHEASALVDFPIDSIESAENACFKIREFIDGNILITLDKDGAVLLHKDKLEAIHYPVEVLLAEDSTAAGDIFRGTFTSEIINGSNISGAIAKGYKFASISILVKGVEEKMKRVSNISRSGFFEGSDIIRK
jgi:ribokinase